MKFLLASLLILAALPLILAKRRRVPFMNCLSKKSNSGLTTVRPARSRVECSIICLNDPDCLSASYCKFGDEFTCRVSEVYLDGGCSGLVTDSDCTQTALMYPCENGGTFFSENRTCRCPDGFLGDYCQRRYRDCFETPGGNLFYHIQPFGSDYVFEWQCSNSYTMTLINAAFTYNYTREWQMMKNGIPIVPGKFFFLGLESLHQLTKQGVYHMAVTVAAQDTGVLWYRNLRVDSETEGYALHWDYFERDEMPFLASHNYLDGFGGAGDATKDLNGARYGTYDNDVNGCAAMKGIGWWYNPSGCMSLDFGPNGPNWPTNRSGMVTYEFLTFFKITLWSANMYVEDDLVL